MGCGTGLQCRTAVTGIALQCGATVPGQAAVLGGCTETPPQCERLCSTGCLGVSERAPQGCAGVGVSNAGEREGNAEPSRRRRRRCWAGSAAGTRLSSGRSDRWGRAEPSPYGGTMPSYTVTVATGSQWFAGTDDYVYLSLEGTEGCSERHLLDKPFYNDFERGAVSAAGQVPVCPPRPPGPAQAGTEGLHCVRAVAHLP